MTNEELVKLIQDGQTEYIPKLWDQVHKFICLQAKRRLIGQKEHIKPLEGDLVNEAYFDLIRAVETYKNDRDATFLHYLTFCIRDGFNRALGVRSSKDKKNPIHNALSLEAPFKGKKATDEAGDLTLQDMIIDHMAEEHYRFIENEDFWRDVHELLEEAITVKLSGMIREAFLVMLHDNCIFSEACRRIGVPEDKWNSMRSMHTAGINQIGRYLRGRAWKKCQQVGIDEYLSIGLRGSGLGAWRRHGFTSSTEMAAIRRVDQELWYQKIVEIFG